MREKTVWNAITKLNHHSSINTAQWIVYDVNWVYTTDSDTDVIVTLHSHPIPPKFTKDSTEKLIQIEASYSFLFGFTVTNIRDNITMYGRGFTISDVIQNIPEVDWLGFDDEKYIGIKTWSREPGYQIWYGRSLADLSNRDMNKSSYKNWEQPKLETVSLLDVLLTDSYSNNTTYIRTMYQYEEENIQNLDTDSLQTIYKINEKYLYVYSKHSILVYSNKYGNRDNTVIPIGKGKFTTTIENATQQAKYNYIEKLSL